MNDKYKPTRKVGAYNRDRTKKWDGKKWVPVNVVHKGQRAKLGGKSVVADGKGNWRSPGTRGNSLQGTRPGSVKGTYQSGDRNRKPLKSIPADKRPADMRKGKVYGDAGSGRNWSNPHGQKSNKPSEGDRSTWGTKTKPKPKPTPTPKPTPKPTPTPKPASTKSTPVRSGAASRKASVPQSKNMDANYKAWAKANPKLAAKVKKGQAGYNAINNKPTATKSTTSNRGVGNGAPGAAGAASRMSPKKTEPAKPKKTKSALEIAAEKRKKKKKAATAKNANDRFRS